ncbi:MAG: AAA family ATPase [Mariprofundaceae bacterium]|nr:AAA family ATPase [Mariprofundaceae bacterium]
MYLKYWGLSCFPFENVSDERFFFKSTAHCTPSEDLQDAIVRGKGAIVLTGDIGCGKTTLVQRILLALSEKRFDIALINYSRLTSTEMLLEICRQLALKPAENNRSAILHVLQEHITRNAESGRNTLICIDEAQSIPSLATFEELRMLLNFQLGGRFLMTILFVGQPELQQKIAKIPQLKQRIALHVKLQQMEALDTTRYILHRLRIAGCSKAILTRQAAITIHRYTRGVPRRINHLMDRSLIIAMRDKLSVLDDRLIKKTIQRYPC